MKNFLIVLIFLSTLSFGLCAEGAEFKRNILAIYDSTEGYNPAEDNNLIHNNAEVVLNYLGMKVLYHDISKGLPSDELMRDIYGIITWFKDDFMPNASEYCKWVVTQAESGKKYIILGNVGAYKYSQSNKLTAEEDINELFNSLDLGCGGNVTENHLVIELVRKDSSMVEFERTLDNEIGNYETIYSNNPENRIYLELKRADVVNSESAAVIVTPKGGFAMEGYVLFIEDSFTGKALWRINPFLFFEEALNLENKPRYDTTTLFGRRIFYSHIDGDGVRNISELDSQSMSGNIIFEEILKKYNLPFTVSFITAELDPVYFGSQKVIDLARKMCSCNNVEIGVHGFSHPLDWKNQLTVFEIKGYAISPDKLEESERTELRISTESHYSKALKIIVGKEEYLKREVEGSVKYINTYIAPQDKKVVIYQWTGNCEPPPEAIDIVNSLGLKNINRGDSRFDRANPSYTGIAPLIRQVDGRVQIHTSNANENIYTNGWNGPFYGFKYLIETFKQTEYPSLIDNIARRITPMNIYYHFYSGEKVLSLNALKENYDYALTQEIIPIFTSQYVSVVEGFLSGKIHRLDDGGWRFTDYGQCRTVRFDCIERFPDLKKSKGISGFRKWQNSLYIHLNEGGEAVLYLTNKHPEETYLKASSGIVSNLSMSPGAVSFTTQGVGENVYELANMSAGSSYETIVKSVGEDKIVVKKIFKAADNGDLSVKIPVQGKNSVEIIIKENEDK